MNIYLGVQKYHAFKRYIYTNNSSVDKSLKKIVNQFWEFDNIKFLGIFSLVLQKNQQWKDKVNNKGQSSQR